MSDTSFQLGEHDAHIRQLRDAMESVDDRLAKIEKHLSEQRGAFKLAMLASTILGAVGVALLTKLKALIGLPS